jgi:hypothetical protein
VLPAATSEQKRSAAAGVAIVVSRNCGESNTLAALQLRLLPAAAAGDDGEEEGGDECTRSAAASFFGLVSLANKPRSKNI